MIPRDYFTSTFNEVGTANTGTPTVATCTVDVSADAPSWATYAVVTWLKSSKTSAQVSAILTHDSVAHFSVLVDTVELSNLFIVLPIAGGDITWVTTGGTNDPVRNQIGGFWF